jgi:hypothetical protein
MGDSDWFPVDVRAPGLGMLTRFCCTSHEMMRDALHTLGLLDHAYQWCDLQQLSSCPFREDHGRFCRYADYLMLQGEFIRGLIVQSSNADTDIRDIEDYRLDGRTRIPLETLLFQYKENWCGFRGCRIFAVASSHF